MIGRFGACDILINNAGTNPSAGPLTDVDLGAIDKTWAVNQRGPLVWSREVWHQAMQKSGGSIVNVSSVGGMQPGTALGAYNVSKAALIHLTRQLAFEMSDQEFLLINARAGNQSVITFAGIQALASSDSRRYHGRHFQ